MALTVQNLRAVGTGVEPASLLPGQIAFNITDKVLYVGDGSNVKTAFDGTQAAGVPGEGWYAMPMDFNSLGDYYVANPGYWGDVPTDQQVLTWSTALNHPIWTSGGAGGGGQVYVTDNATVAAASGATVSDKITTAIGVASPDEGDVTIVTGLPDEVYEGLYFFTTEWIRGASYAYPSASEVIYDNTAHPDLTPTVQGAISDLDDGLAATTAIANTANSTATSALSIASAALPRAGGTMTGTIVARNIDIQTSYFLQFNGGGDGQIFGITDSKVFSSSTTAASAKAVADTYAVAAAALPVAGGIMTGPITFAAGQIFPVSGIQDATYIQKGVVQVGTNIDVLGGVISVKTATSANLGLVQTGTNIQNSAGVISVLTGSASQKGVLEVGTNLDVAAGVISVADATTSNKGVVQLNDAVNSTSILQAATANAVKVTYDLANAAVPRSSYTADGDILVGTAPGTFGALSVGAEGQILTVQGGVPTWTDDAPGDVTSVTGTAPIVVDNLDPENPVVSVDAATTATLGVVQIDLTGNINVAGGVITVPNASTTIRGAVQLNNTLSSTSTTEALTAAQGKALQDQISTLNLTNSVILAGGYDATTGLVDGVTAQGTAAGFVDGAVPPAASSGNVDHYLICTTAGTNPSAMENGDWLLSSETSPGVYAYVVLGVGARPATASYTQAGVVQLADGAAVLAGTSDATAITPQALQDNVIDSVTTSNSNLIASATAVKIANDNALTAQTLANNAQTTANAALPKAGGTMTGTISAHNVDIQSGFSLQFAGGINGSVDGITDSTSTTDSTIAASATAVKAAYNLANAAVPNSSFLASGDLLVGTGAGTYGNLPAGAADYVLSSDGAGNLVWVDNSKGDVTSVTGTAPITVDNTDSQNPVIGIDAASTTQAGAVQLNDTTNSTSTTEAATANAVKTAYDLAATANTTATAALPVGGGTMTGTITFASGQVFPVSGIQDATTSQKGVVQVGTNIQVSSGTISVNTATTGQLGLVQVGSNIQISAGTISVRDASTTQSGVVQLTDSTSSISTTTAATPNAVKTAWDLANAALPLSGGTMSGNIVLFDQVPVDPAMPASKYYADQIASGIRPQVPVAAATTAAFSGTVTYNNGTAGVGATLTLGTPITTVDGVAVNTVGTRILVKNQASTFQNGVYTFTTAGTPTVLTRATDSDQPSELLPGNSYYVTGGTVNGTQTFFQIPTVTTIGTSPITYTLSSTKPFHKYSLEWNVDPVAGDDINGTGSEEQPYKTIAKALSVAGGSGARIVLHQGIYTENLTITNQNLDLWGANRNGATINGTVNFANTAASIRAYGIQFQGNVTHSGNGGLYLQQYTLASGVTLTKTGNGYLELDDGSSDTSSHSFTGAGYVNIFNSRIGLLTVNNAAAIVTLFNNSSAGAVTVTSGILQIINSVIFAATESGNAVSSAVGSTVYLRNSGFYTPSGATARVNLPGNYSLDNVTLDRANSTFGTNLGTVARFDSIDVFGPIFANGSAGASGTFISQDGKTITVTNGLITSIV